MRNLFLITAALIVSLQCYATGNYNSDWQKANSYYQQKQYDSAAIWYEQIAGLKPLNAEIYYNLGNTYYRLNKIGFAVLNYERAIKIKPDYKEAKENMILAQNRIANRIPEVADIFFVRWWEAITGAEKATAWAVTALVIFLLFIGLLLLKQLKKMQTPVQLRGILVLLILCFLALAYISAQNSIQNKGAVIIAGDAPLMKSGLTGKPLLQVPEGTVVKIKEEKGDWLQVRLPNGVTGWLQKSLVSKI